MTITNKRNSIIFAIVSLIALAIGIILVPVVKTFAVVVITLAAVALVYAIYNLVKIVIAEREANNDGRVRTIYRTNTLWRDLVRILTLVGVIVIIIILARSCGKQVIKEQTVINQTVVNQQVENADIDNADVENANINNAEINNANIDNATIENAEIENAEINNANIDKAEIKEATIENAEIGNANIDNATIEDATIKNAEIENANIENANINNANINQTKTEPVTKPDNTKKPEETKQPEEVKKPEETKKPEEVKKPEQETKPTHVCSVANTIVIDATCTKAGRITEVCSCGKTLSEKVIEATGHVWNKGEVTKEATEKSTGTKTYTCKKCGETKTEKIDKLEHVCKVYDTIEKEATCTKDGYIRKVCSCGEVISEKRIKATGHDYEIVGEREATSTKDGYIKYRCTNCGDTYKDVIPATGEDDNKPVDDEFVITINKMKVVGNEFDAVEVYTSGNANDLIVLQNQKVFNYYVKDSHHLILTVGDEDTFAKVRIYDPAHEDKVVEVRRLSPVDPMA